MSSSCRGGVACESYRSQDFHVTAFHSALLFSALQMLSKTSAKVDSIPDILNNPIHALKQPLLGNSTTRLNGPMSIVMDLV